MPLDSFAYIHAYAQLLGTVDSSDSYLNIRCWVMRRIIRVSDDFFTSYCIGLSSLRQASIQYCNAYMFQTEPHTSRLSHTWNTTFQKLVNVLSMNFKSNGDTLLFLWTSIETAQEKIYKYSYCVFIAKYSYESYAAFLMSSCIRANYRNKNIVALPFREYMCWINICRTTLSWYLSQNQPDNHVSTFFYLNYSWQCIANYDVLHIEWSTSDR
jgi:hypothetical protein